MEYLFMFAAIVKYVNALCPGMWILNPSVAIAIQKEKQFSGLFSFFYTSDIIINPEVSDLG